MAQRVRYGPDVRREELISYLAGKVGRCRWVWWNGELLSLGEALGRASRLPPSVEAIVSGDEVVVYWPSRGELGAQIPWSGDEPS